MGNGVAGREGALSSEHVRTGIGQLECSRGQTCPLHRLAMKARRIELGFSPTQPSIISLHSEHSDKDDQTKRPGTLVGTGGGTSVSALGACCQDSL